MSTKDIYNGITVVAIAKNEGRYIVEWLAYHLAIGVEKIIVYSHDTEDDQRVKLDMIAKGDRRVEWVNWPSVRTVSPQISAYNDALQRISTPWVGFIDLDEFIVPSEHDDVRQWLATVPTDISSVHINWRGFGAAGRQTDDYVLVTRTFEMACPVNWSNHHHFKTIARSNLAKKVLIHDVITRQGRRTLADFREFTTINNGLSDRICYHRIQINHYQCKTYVEFEARMRRGRVEVPPEHPGRWRDGSLKRFSELDLNAEPNFAIRRFDKRVNFELAHMTAVLTDRGYALQRRSSRG